jgi:hypothetical protein
MRTDTQRLDYVLTIVEQQDEEAADKLGAAYTLGFRGRVMVDAAMGARIIEPGQPMPELTALDLVGAELGRIRNVKGFSEDRDDLYAGQELVWASIAYLTPGDERHDHGGGPEVWPWSEGSFKPSPDDRKKELTKGIALAVCELDRLIRAERRAPVVIGIDPANGPDVCVVDGVVQPQPREFKVGDRVRVIRHSAWGGWAPDMDKYVGNGEEYEITELSYEQVRVDGWYFPIESLEHVDD